ncbi:HAMP domain-containing protein, partial [Streptomyces sp. NRRL B-3229]|uniref:HAMP domain-containing protein n=1 Tax=Streptomyces sp. NRRL B-3229 TaxID=1463836 RepID=UPI000690BB9F
MAAERRARPGERAGRAGRLPWRRSLLVRLLAASITIAVCSVAATAWLAARTTTSALQREQGQVLADDARIYDTLMGYAATHTDWSAVAPALARLAERTGRRITLTTQDRRPVAVSGPASQDLPTRASALVDPLRADPALLPGVQADGIDPRAVGPYRLPAGERKQLSHLARTLRTCLRGTGFSAGVTEGASGRPSLVMTGDTGIQRKVGEACGVFALDAPTTTEKRALDRLNALVGGCLKRQRLDPVVVGLAFAPAESVSEPVRRCVDTARREQLAPYVAPPVLLFVASAAGSPAAPGFDLSSANTAKVAGVAALVLVLTLAVTVTVGTRLVRPLRALTDAARHPTQEHLRVPVTTHDEIGRLAAAFNDLSERRERLEEQRKAMVSDVAHELRTPLTTIRGWLEAAQDGLAASDEAFVASLLE